MHALEAFLCSGALQSLHCKQFVFADTLRRKAIKKLPVLLWHPQDDLQIKKDPQENLRILYSVISEIFFKISW